MNVSIVDYGSGNLKSVEKSLIFASLKLGKNFNIKITSSPKDILNSDKIILPGQGSYKQCADSIKSISGLWDALNESVLIKKKPIFGICVGMQLFADEGFEVSKTKGFGWISGSVRKIQIKDKDLKLPHMGWNNIPFIKKNDLFLDIKDSSDYYFIHSYYFDAKYKTDILATVEYNQTIVAALLKNNIFGTQFHPEKSHINGISLLFNFLSWKI